MKSKLFKLDIQWINYQKLKVRWIISTKVNQRYIFLKGNYRLLRNGEKLHYEGSKPVKEQNLVFEN